MPTLVDELIVRLELDPSNFDKGQKAAVAAWLKTKQEATSGAKSIEDASKKAADAIDRATKSVLALFGVLVGARGLKDFVAGVTTSDAALGRFATTLNESPQAVQAWELAVQRLGGASADADAALGRANQQLYNLRVNGQRLPDEILRLGAYSQQHGGPGIDTSHGLDAYLSSLGGAAHNVAQSNPALASYLLNQAGLGGAFGNLLMQRGGARLQPYLNSMPTVSNDTIQNLTDLQNRWSTLQQTVSQFAQTFLGDFEPALRPFLDDFQKFFDGAVKAEPELAKLGKDAADIANSLGGWRVALEAMAALWAGGKLVGLLGAVRMIFGGGAAAASAGSGLGPLGVTAALLGWDAYNNTVKQAGAGEGDVVRSNNAAAVANGYKPGYIYDPASGSYYPPGGSPPSGDRASVLRQIAAANGLDPDKFVALARGEGLNQYVGDQGSSFGDFQLHMGGLSAAMPGTGLGDEFMAQTGLDPRDKSTWRQQDEWVAKYIRAHGAAKWSAARSLGLTNMTAGNAVSVNIQSMTVNTRATDARGIAGDMAPALKQQMQAQPANTGPQ